MKIAICLTGQLRTWKEAHRNQKWFWETSGVEVDYFVHTWNYSQDRTAVSKPYETRPISDEEYGEFLAIYNPKKSILDTKVSTDFYGNDHWSCLFYSLSQVLHLKKQYELENNFKYDLVVKSRPDLVFNPGITFSWPPLRDNQIHSTHGGLMPMEFNMFNINDCVFLGNSYSMDLLHNLYFYRQYKINNKFKHSINVHPLGPGVLMHEFFRDYGITPIVDLSFLETIVKAGYPEGVDLFDVEDFNKMESYFRNWYYR